jgi:hypothetical protein
MPERQPTTLRSVPPLPVHRAAPLRCSTDALRTLFLAAAQPLAAETLVIVLDAHGYGGVVTIIGDTTEGDAVLGVAECFSLAAECIPGASALVLATVRPTGCVLPGDIDRWLEASAVADRHGIRLIEWYVISASGVQCPRDLLGEPERWSLLRSAPA